MVKVNHNTVRNCDLRVLVCWVVIDALSLGKVYSRLELVRGGRALEEQRGARLAAWACERLDRVRGNGHGRCVG